MSDSSGRNAGIGFYGFGCILAIVISYDKWHSILWAVLHGILSWLYVIYHVVFVQGYIKF